MQCIKRRSFVLLMFFLVFYFLFLFSTLPGKTSAELSTHFLERRDTSLLTLVPEMNPIGEETSSDKLRENGRNSPTTRREQRKLIVPNQISSQLR